MVSKLKVKPFQSVNSPLDAPVINRRPSGVHLKKMIEILEKIKQITNKQKKNIYQVILFLHKHKTLDEDLYWEQRE